MRIVRSSRAALGLLILMWAPAGFAAVTATLTAGVHLRAGPAIGYPSVMLVPPGAVVQVFGCEEGYNWCDVQFGADRGWVDAAFLQAPAPSGPVVIATSPAVIGVPIVAFSFNTYWNAYYVGRPWYGRRAYYYNYWNRYPHGRPPPIYRPPPVYRPPPPRPPPVVRPPPQRPPPGTRPPSGGRPPGGKPPGGKPPPGGNKPPPGNRPPPSTRPATTPGQ
jgi:uncharacterized protein YraI